MTGFEYLIRFASYGAVSTFIGFTALLFIPIAGALTFSKLYDKMSHAWIVIVSIVLSLSINYLVLSYVVAQRLKPHF